MFTYPAFAELERHAAQGTLLHNDDTYARVLEFMGKRRAELLRSGELPAPDRVGLFTTGIVSFTNEQPIVLFYTGRSMPVKTWRSCSKTWSRPH